MSGSGNLPSFHLDKYQFKTAFAVVPEGIELHLREQNWLWLLKTAKVDIFDEYPVISNLLSGFQ